MVYERALQGEDVGGGMIRPRAPIHTGVGLADVPAITSLPGAGVPPGVTSADGTVTASTGTTSGSVSITSIPTTSATTGTISGTLSNVWRDVTGSTYFWPVVLVLSGIYVWRKSKGGKK